MDKKFKENNNIRINNNKSDKRNSFLKFLTRRSTKVEPRKANGDDDDEDDEIYANKNNLLNHFHDDDIVADNDVDLKNNMPNRVNNRIPSLCCTPNDKSITPPNITKNHQTPLNNPNSSQHNSIVTVHVHRPNSYTSQELENSLKPDDIRNGTTPSTPHRLNSSRRARPLSFSQDEEVKSTSEKNVSFIQPSIAMQHSRSRLRLKLLPPDHPDGHQMYSNHASTPEISNHNDKEVKLNGHCSKAASIETLHRMPTGTNSLAMQSLMAAEVLHLIPTEKARDRNYLAGRLGAISLLGKWQLERVLPSKEIKIFVGSWNMNGQSPPKQMNDFVLPLGVEHVPEIVAIGTQESCSERFEWEVTLQETLGPSHILLHSTSLGTLHLAVFIRRDLIWYCSVPEDDCLSVRPGSAFRTKGAVAISFCLFGTSMLFVTSHLTAHQQKVKERVQDIKRITHALDLPRNLPVRRNKDVTQNFDMVFWCGDLNFRLGEPRDKLLKWIETTQFPLPSHLPHGYMHTDQLSSVLSDGAAFKGFKEANITFPPTYKYDPGTQQFDTSSKQRAPAYTDRILYKYRRSLSALRRGSGALMGSHFQATSIDCIKYDSVPSIITSDHKPVWGLFKSTIQPGIDTIPLAAGLFNREVYLEGMKRRLYNNDSGSSAVCSIQ